MIMPWGKFRGRDVRNVPTSYPAWIIETPHVRDARGRAAARELGRRFGDGGSERARAMAASSRVPPALCSVAHEIVERGFRHRARERHPDHGGDHRRMIELNTAIAVLRAVIGGGGPGPEADDDEAGA
jgi:hypothetical protein